MRSIVAGYIFGAIKNGKSNFKKFYSLMNYSKPIKSVSELGQLDYIDVFCVGSDQVWNPVITNGFDEVFLLNNLKIKNKISFSSSMGSLNYKIENEEVLKECLKSFNAISVREKIAQEYISNLTSKNVENVVDPTLMFSKDEWSNILKLDNVKEKIKEKYVLIYALGDWENLNIIANEIASLLKIKVATITLSNRKKKVDYLVSDATPEDFVKLIANASFVVTNSFHGTCFSIINQVPFYSVQYGSNPKRVENMLEQYGMISRFYNKDTIFSEKILDNVDIINATEYIQKDVEKSYKWLEGALDGIC